MARSYEVVFIVNPVLGDEAIQATADKVQNLIESSATDVQIDDWGKRRMSYPIMDQKEGHYVRIGFTAEAEVPKEIERVLKITEGILRFLVVRLDD